ncbi:MAG: AMP-binding protein [Rhodocyclaceae bacterium]|nr:AMP-binding protein [Rhodocyclaceae bacterium]
MVPPDSQHDLLACLRRHAGRAPEAVAIEGSAESLGYATLIAEIDALAARLGAQGPRVVGLLAENGPDWALADLACLAAGLPLVPLPTFFSREQLAHVVAQAGIDCLLTDRPGALAGIATVTDSGPFRGALHLLHLRSAPVALPRGTAKVTFTSGTTGAPKGVCLSREAMTTVASSLASASGAHSGDRHLAVLPLSTLLENIGGLYVPLMAGARTRLLPGEAVGLLGSSSVDPVRMLSALAEAQSSSAILVPQLLQALVAALSGGCERPAGLRFVAVGGAPVPARVIDRAHALGLPVFEGYGLSECGSVVTLNRPGDAQSGTAGRPLDHVQLRIDGDGAVQVRGAGFLGYLGEPGEHATWLDTGDLGQLDANGRLCLLGRRKHLFITAFGRNVSPEWIEGELLTQPAIAQAAVFGEGRPWNVAVIVPCGNADDQAIDAAIRATNEALPDYARIGRWLRADAPFSPANDQLTGNGRPRRGVIAAAHARAIEDIYCHDERTHHGLLRRA